jgi:hypothetical protein
MVIALPQSIPPFVDALGVLVIGLAIGKTAIRFTPRWNLTERGWFVVVVIEAVASVLLARWLLWPAFVWLCQVGGVPDWLSNLITSAGFGIFLGAFLATLGGMFQAWWQEQRRRAGARRAFNTLVREEMLYMAPRADPLQHDPRTARRITLTAIPQLLSSGILDPEADTDLISELVLMLSLQTNFNEKARNYDAAWAAGEPPKKLQLLYNDLQMSYWDYRDSHGRVVAMLWRLGDPPPDEEEDAEALLRETPRKKASKMLRRYGLVESELALWERNRDALRREWSRFGPDDF